MEMGSISPPPTTHQTNNSTCDLYEHEGLAHILLPVFYGLIFIIGMFGNVLALIVVIKNRKKINSTTLYSTNLVVSDILFTTALPARIIYYAKGFDWPFGEGLCKLTALIFYINTYAAVNFMTCLSIDRFVAVVHPLRTRIRTVRCATYICCSVWFLVLAQTLPLLTQPLSRKEEQRNTCMEYPNFETIPNLPWILLGACLLGYVIPLGIILVCYSKIGYKLYQNAKQNPLVVKSGTNKKAINMIFFIIVVFTVCLTPYHVAIIKHMIAKIMSGEQDIECRVQKLFQKTLHYTVFLMNLNCCLDPLIYFFACRGYKRTIMRILRRQGSISLSSAARTAPEESSRDIGDSNTVNVTTALNGKR
ncbi:G-protein coupled receptor 183 [Sphaerodactylus townsendi]|uniref:G-protein coupled receptor 183 n=1 Tax=Sphaerodactylus townsendi TaxID=933632 RepID=UPI002026F404|nr:G-protein coupled receptor 183 [Sphaerodactylus townsendi]XP_048349020.1 G-protein coupled receptor 183 [Sphaerodactylus townsendi]